jgi:hypothetical protein
MADFLTRVAQRALGVAPVVRPVIPSRYAPGPRPPSIDDEPFEVAVERERSAPRPPIRADRENPEPTYANPGRKSAETAVTDTEARASAPTNEQVDDATPPPRKATPAIEPLADRPTTKGSTPEPAPLREPVAAGARPTIEATPSHRGALAADARPANEATLSREEWGVARVDRPEGPASFPVGREPAAEAAPIRITIGRIDVRAILPATAPAPRQAADAGRPAMTLEDYTRRRNRSER